MHQALPLDDLLVGGSNGVVPVGVEVGRDDAVVCAVHDEGRLGEGRGVEGVVGLGHAHLLDHAEAHVLVVVRILLVVLDNGRVGADAARQRVRELDEGLSDGRGQVNRLRVAHGLGQQDAVEAGELLHGQLLTDGRIGVLLSLGEVVSRDDLGLLGVMAPRVDGDAATVADDAVNGSRVLGTVGLNGETTHRVAEEEDLLALVLLVGSADELVDVIDEVVPVVDVAARDGVVDVGTSAASVSAVVEAVGRVPGVIEAFGQVVVTAGVLSGAMDDDDCSLGVRDDVLAEEELGTPVIGAGDVAGDELRLGGDRGHRSRGIVGSEGGRRRHGDPGDGHGAGDGQCAHFLHKDHVQAPLL